MSAELPLPAAESSTAPRAAGPTPSREAGLFWRLRARIFSTMAAQMLRTARFRLAVLLIVSVAFWVALFYIFAEGFAFLRSSLVHEGTRAATVQAIYNLFFLALSAMLTLSSAIILYGNLYRSEEVDLLLTLPARTERIVLYKYQEAVLISCWGFLLLGSPMLVAYGLVNDSPWYYFALLGPLLAAFAFIPTALGACACMLVVYLLPRARRWLLGGAVAALLLTALWAGWSVIGARPEDVMTPQWLRDTLERLRFSERRLLPSWWLSTALLEASHPPSNAVDSWNECLGLLAVLSSNALLGYLLVAWVGRGVFRAGRQELAGLGSGERTGLGARLDRWLDLWLAVPVRLLPAGLGQLLLKDWRLFRRDPLQWSQVLIFAGLLVLYFFNMRRFNYGDSFRQWMTTVGFLNVAVVGLMLSAFTTRFVFPMISLEGRRFWILGTLPLRREAVLWSKLVFAVGGSLPPCAALVLLSDGMLRVLDREPLLAAIHLLACVILSLGLCSLAVGLGARLPNLRERSPSKIAAGFGGTLNLVLSALFIFAVVGSTGVPAYFWMEARAGNAPRWPLAESLGLGSLAGVLGGMAAALVLGGLATVIPLRLGMRHFRRLEG